MAIGRRSVPPPLSSQTLRDLRGVAVQCKRKKRDGNRCRARALSGKKYCALHAEPGKAAELGRKGGRVPRGPRGEMALPMEIRPPQTAQEVREILGDVIADVRARRLDTKTASTLGYLGGVLLKAIETADLEQRLARLEERLESQEPSSL